MINIVLVEPEIPANAGNIARTCAASGTRLHMVRPFGFSLDDRQLKRAGLDYWHLLDIRYYDSFAEVAAAAEPGAKFYFASTKGGAVYSRCPLCRRGLHRFRQGNQRIAGGAPARKLRKLHTHTDGGGRKVAEPFQFRGDSALRGAPPDRFFGYAAPRGAPRHRFLSKRRGDFH